MKKISAKLFFSVLWKGICQAIEWLLGLLGYKREGKVVKFIWRSFAMSATVLLTIFIVVFLMAIANTIYDKYYKEVYCYNPDCRHAEYLGKNIYYHNLDDGKGYVFNSLTKEKTVKNIVWLSTPVGDDSLACFNDGKKRGYLNMKTGQVVIPARYNHAWIFSEGLASVEENGSIKFIDGTGKTVIDNVTDYRPQMDALLFHGGYCVVDQDGPELSFLIDKRGMALLPQEYNSIVYNETYGLWQVQRGDEQGVYDANLNPIIPLTKCDLFIGDGTIDLTLADHTMRKYDLNGMLIDDFYYGNIKTLEYETDEIAYRKIIEYDDDYKPTSETNEPYHPQAIARLRAYGAGGGYEGLMTADGHRVTMPIYQGIEAIGPDLYACTVTNGDILVVNGKGEVVK